MFMKLIKRDKYLERLSDVTGTPDIKVITGIRRAGKSKLLDAYSEELMKHDPASNIVRIDLRKKKFENLLDGNQLYQYARDHIISGTKNYLMVDEIQDSAGFERVINSLLDEGEYEIFITGSNAFLLSSDLATLFGGRTFDLHILPFSFAEFLQYFPGQDRSAAFDAYVEKGGMAGSYLYKNTSDARQYLEGIVRTTIVKDVVKKFRIENEPLLNMTIDYLMDNIGNKTSLRNIADTLTRTTAQTNHKTVSSYVDALCKAYLFYPVTRYDIKGKKYLESDKKYYLSDLGFRFAILGTKKADYGRMYENLVALELIRRGYEVYVGVLYQKEIDFVTIRNGEKTYIQVSDDISDDSTFEREVKPLLAIRDSYPKVLIARTRHSEQQYEGIRIIDIADWLADDFPKYKTL